MKHIIDPPPKNARCAKKGCAKKASQPHLLGELILMQDGTIHESVEWLCEGHASE